MRFRRLLVALAAAAIAPLAAIPAHAADFSIQPDVEYAAPGGVPLRLDAFLPTALRLSPAVVVIHGGGWTTGSRAEVAFEGRWFAEHGIAAFVIDYRLAPRYPYPAAVEDAQAAVRFVRENALSFGVDANRIAAFGGSAGGHVAAMLAVLGEGSRDTGSRVRAAVSWSGPMDLWRTIADVPENIRPAVDDLIRRFVPCRVDCDARLREASPITYVDRSDGALLVANSRSEATSIAQARAMARALDAAGVPYRLVEVPGSLHAEQYSQALVLSSPETVLEATLDFVRRWVDTPRAPSGELIPRPFPVAATSSAGGAIFGAGLVVGMVIARRRRPISRRLPAPLAPATDPAAIAYVDSLARFGVSSREIEARLAHDGYGGGRPAA